MENNKNLTLFYNIDFKIILSGVCSTILSIGIGRFIYTPILPNMQDDLSLDSTTMGAISSYNYLGYLIGSIIPLVSRFQNLRNIIIFSSIFTSFTIFLMGITTNLNFFISLRFLCGITSALSFVSTINLMFDHFRNFKNKNLQLIHFCGIGLGITLGTLTVWTISELGFKWQGQWMIVGLISMLLCIPVALFTPLNIYQEASINKKSKNILSLNFIMISVGYFLFGVGYIIFGTFISAMIKNSQEINSLQYISWLFVGFFAIPSVIIWNKLSKKIKLDHLLFFSCSTVTIGLIFLLIQNNIYFLLISCALYGLGVPGSVAFILVEGKKRFIGNISFAVAILTTGFSLGQILGPFISGILIDLTKNYFNSILLAMLCLFFSGLLMLEIKKSNRT